MPRLSLTENISSNMHHDRVKKMLNSQHSWLDNMAQVFLIKIFEINITNNDSFFLFLKILKI